MKGLKSMQYVFMGICISLVLLLTAVDIASFSLTSHMKLFEKYNITQATGLTIAELENVMEDVLAYFEDDRVLLDTTITVDSREVPAFGERAVTHMVDVKYLFVTGRVIRNICLILVIALGLLAMKLDRAWKHSFRKMFGGICVINFSLMGILYLLMNLDFYKYFTYFHQIFFRNDLWILDPQKELMIKMLPEGFFMDTAFKIAAIFVAGNIIMGITSVFLKRKLKTKY